MEREVWINRQLQEDGPNGNDGFNPLKGDSGSNRSTPPGVEGKPQTHAQAAPLKASDVTLGAASSAHAASHAASAPSGPQRAQGSQQRANVESGVEQALFSADELVGPSSGENAVAPASAARLPDPLKKPAPSRTMHRRPPIPAPPQRLPVSRPGRARHRRCFPILIR